MPISPSLVEEAARLLKSSSATPQEKLVLGGKFLWTATTFSEDWTPELLDRARTASRFLYEHGTVKKTVAKMDEKTAIRCLAQFTEDLTQLATDIERVRSQQPRTS